MGSFLAADLRRKWPDKSLTRTKRDWSHTEPRGIRLRRSEYLLVIDRRMVDTQAPLAHHFLEVPNTQ